MQRSEQVAAAVEAWCERMTAGDATGVGAILAEDPEAFTIGTQRIGAGRDEWLSSIQQMTRMGVAWVASGLRSWEVGDGGFAAVEITATLPDGTELPMRATAFAVRDDAGAFRLFNVHFSWAVPDEVAMPQVGAWREQLGLAC
ncbi:MAG TPA: nuclear transport factor 2 family protein [Solirubrobacteraceae bacterium]|jgi:ketosteroid isomerase-like protein|nr:nuclear transport factor 2 family protein [Solirubrobacteraceae bacterium]